jgi:molybdopterin-guanine dinucleotide biosynthesis protein A
MHPEVLGAVLAGGAGTRVGGGKPSLPLCGRPLIAYPIAAMREAGLEPVVVAKDDTQLPPLDVPVVHDDSAILHPLAGVLAALDHAAGHDVIVVGTDMPDIPPQLLRRLAAAEPGADVVVATVEGELQPLCARYGPGARDALARALADEAPMRATVAALDPVMVKTDAAAVRNVNTLADLGERWP